MNGYLQTNIFLPSEKKKCTNLMIVAPLTYECDNLDQICKIPLCHVKPTCAAVLLEKTIIRANNCPYKLLSSSWNQIRSMTTEDTAEMCMCICITITAISITPPLKEIIV